MDGRWTNTGGVGAKEGGDGAALREVEEENEASRRKGGERRMLEVENPVVWGMKVGRECSRSHITSCIHM